MLCNPKDQYSEYSKLYGINILVSSITQEM